MKQRKWHSLLATVASLVILITTFSIVSVQAADEFTNEGLTLSVSSVLNAKDYPSGKLIDNDPTSTWASEWKDEKNAAKTEWLAMELPEIAVVSAIQLTPRMEKLCFPADFSIQYSMDGSKWVVIPGQEYTDYKLTGKDPINFTFAAPVTAKQIRVYVTKRTADGNGNHLVMIAEVKVNKQAATAEQITVGQTAFQAATAFQSSTPTQNSAYSSDGLKITVSSVLTAVDYPAEKLMDNDPTSTWASEWKDEKNAACNEWFTMELPKISVVKGIQLTPRLEKLCFPGDFSMQYSLDGSKWIAIEGQTYTGYTISSANPIDFAFAKSVTAKYIRVYVTKRTPDGNGNHIVMIAEAKVERKDATQAEITAAETAANNATAFAPPTTTTTTTGPTTAADKEAELKKGTTAEGLGLKIETSSWLTTTGWEAGKMLDNDPTTSWCSSWNNETSETCNEKITVNAGEVKKFNSITLKPQEKKNCFPVDFSFQSSTDNIHWTDIPEASYTGYKITSNANQVFTFKTPVVAQYIRITVTKRSPDGNGAHLVMIAELRADMVEATAEEAAAAIAIDANQPVPLVFTVETSSLLGEAYKTEYLIDDDPNTLWGSEWINEKAPKCTEWIKITADRTATYQSVTIYPRSDDPVGFPADFVFQYSFDGENWINIEGAAYTDYKITDNSGQVFTFAKPITAEYLRIYMTKRTADGNGNYIITLSEIKITAVEASQSDVTAAKTTFETQFAAQQAAIQEAAKPRDDTAAVYIVFGCMLAVIAAMVVLFFILKRKKVFLIAGGAVLILGIAFGVYVSMSVSYNLTMDIGAGQTIFVAEGAYGYRYGPSMMYDDTGLLNAWFSAPGSNGGWDDLTYQSSSDNGKTWSKEIISIQPTPNSEDRNSTCDPGAFKLGDYYYVGYTSTINEGGLYNNVYLARSKNQAGPWEKWNGSGWSDQPQAILYYGNNVEGYGIGEPSFVVMDDQIYIYYTYIGNLDNGQKVRQTRLAIADAAGENWPSTIKKIGPVIEKEDSQDSSDVKYIDAYKLFMAVTTYDRMGSSSVVKVYTSPDGINFKEATVNANGNTKQWLHNIGVTGNTSGHYDLDMANYIGYAYGVKGVSFGKWNTDINSITITANRLIDLTIPLLKFQPLYEDPDFEGGVMPAIWALSKSSDQRSAEMAADDNAKSFYSSSIHNRADYHEALAVKLDSGKANSMTVTARENGYGFPTEFKLQYSNDGLNWTDIEGQSYTDYKVEAGITDITFTFNKTIKAKAVRMLATKLGADDFENYSLQLVNVKAN